MHSTHDGLVFSLTVPLQDQFSEAGRPPVFSLTMMGGYQDTRGPDSSFDSHAASDGPVVPSRGDSAGLITCLPIIQFKRDIPCFQGCCRPQVNENRE